MEYKHISEWITDYKNGDPDALEQLWKPMLPLIKKYAGKTHFMEYDDVCQEYSIAPTIGGSILCEYQILLKSE